MLLKHAVLSFLQVFNEDDGEAQYYDRLKGIKSSKDIVLETIEMVFAVNQSLIYES